MFYLSIRRWNSPGRRAGGRGPVEEVHPNFYGLDMRFVDIEQVEPPDFVFLALPAAPSIEVAARFLDAGSRVIDLGSAFRLRDRATWESVYGQAHGRWDLASGGA